MLIQRQLTNRILVDAQRLRKESLELRHDCRNTRSISRLLRDLLKKESHAHQVGLAHSSIHTIRRSARHDLLRQLKGCIYIRGLQWSNSLAARSVQKSAPNAAPELTVPRKPRLESPGNNGLHYCVSVFPLSCIFSPASFMAAPVCFLALSIVSFTALPALSTSDLQEPKGSAERPTRAARKNFVILVMAW